MLENSSFVVVFQLLSFAFEHRSIELIFSYIDLRKNKDVRLAFDALKVSLYDDFDLKTLFSILHHCWCIASLHSNL
jgi:hypothetical protein